MRTFKFNRMSIYLVMSNLKLSCKKLKGATELISYGASWPLCTSRDVRDFWPTFGQMWSRDICLKVPAECTFYCKKFTK